MAETFSWTVKKAARKSAGAEKRMVGERRPLVKYGAELVGLLKRLKEGK